ncbi:unnamed protein product [Rangifer tarandus platyrhynchus]|uniref:Uncharacterized protein n=1 Tax=Rangifer tarandus platyrhynchus TaxID=3082113 RepID=A0AC60A9P1_RANTA
MWLGPGLLRRWCGNQRRGKDVQVSGHLRGPCHLPTPEELLELGAVVERGNVYSEAKQVLGPLSPLLNHRGFKPAKHLGAGEGWELLEAAEEVAVGVGQVSMQLSKVTVPLPDHHLFDILWVPL